MNRVINFRAWDTLSPKMFKGHSVTIQSDGTVMFLNGAGDWIEGGERVIIMQFTGLLDKSGKEIYEGDVVKCGYGIGEVVYMLGGFWVRWIHDKEADMEMLGLNKKFRHHREDQEAFEIIGNIYEHPNLLP
jgi:uncharacterized phage protein (TIGR01671 family)